jgi:hypothetical protein
VWRRERSKLQGCPGHAQTPQGRQFGWSSPSKGSVGHLRATEGEEICLLEGPDNSYRLTALDPSFQKKMEKAEEIMGRYRNALHVLSK